MKEDYLILSVLRRLKTLRRSLGDFDGHLSRSQPVAIVEGRGRNKHGQWSYLCSNCLHLNYLVTGTPEPVRQTLFSQCALRPVYAAIYTTTDQNTKRRNDGVKFTVYVDQFFLHLVVKVRTQRARNSALKEVFSLGDVNGSGCYKKTCKRRLCSEWIGRGFFRWNEGAVFYL